MNAVSRHPHRQPDPRVGQNNGTSKRIWLLLYTQGGSWTAEEIARALQIERPLWNGLCEMVRARRLVRTRVITIDGERLVKFAVTHKCEVPRGVVVEEIDELLRLPHGGKR